MIAWVARAATPIATMARSAVGSGRTADRNWSARARSTTRRIAWPRGVSRSVRWRRSSGSWCRSTRRRRTRPSTRRLVADGRPPDLLGQLADRHRAAVGEHVERGELGEAEPQLPELAGEADDQLAPERTAHRHALADLADVREPVAGGEDRRGQVGLEAAGDRAPRDGTSAGRSGRTRAKRRQRPTSVQPCTRIGARQAARALRSPANGISPTSFPARARSPSAWVEPSPTPPRRPPRSSPRPTPRSASPCPPSPGTGPAEQLDRTEQRPAGASSRPRSAILAALRERWAAAGCAEPRPRVRRRPLDGPVLRARRRRGALARRRPPPRPRARPARCRAHGRVATARWPRSSGSTTRGSRSSSRRPRRTASSSSPTATPPGQVVVSGRAARRRGRRRDRQVARREAGDRPARLGRGPLAAHGRGGRRACAPPSPASTFHDPEPPAAGQRRRPADHHRRGLPRRARRAPDRRRRLGRRRRADARRGRDDLRRGRTGQGPDRPHPAHRPGRRGHRRRRPGAATTASSTSPTPA